MKQNILSMLLFAAVFVGCHNEEIEKEFPSGKTAVTIEVEGEQPDNARSVSFTGGTAYGEGLYDGAAKPTVGADASDGYEIDYFYGGPSSEPRKYDYTSGGTSASFWVSLNGMNHSFKCSFKEKKRTLTLVASPSSGGTVSGSGMFKVKKSTPISASPASGYTFSGWTVSSGDATIANASSASTTATLQSSNSTLTANFKKAGKSDNYINVYATGKISKGFTLYLIADLPLASDVTIVVNARGTWWVTDNVDGNREWEEDFPDISQTFTLKKGEIDFTLNIGVGNSGGSAGQVTSLGSVNYATTLKTDTDEFYNYRQTDNAGFIYW